MPIKGGSVCMPIVIINLRVRGVRQDSVPIKLDNNNNNADFV